MWMISLFAALAVLWAAAYRQVGIKTWVAALIVSAVALTPILPWYLLVPLWLVTGTICLTLLLPEIRRQWLTSALLKQFRKVLPPMSDTEREALEAGTVWWDAELFSGRPRWGRLLKTPPAVLSPKEQRFLAQEVETLCLMLDDWQITHQDQDLPQQAWNYIREKGFFGLILPEQYGGLEFSAYAHSQVVIKLASRSIVAAVTVMVPNSLGPGKLLLHYGTQKQKDHYLPRLAKGVEIPCFALTGPDAGSDAGAMPDDGIVCKGQWQGQEVLGVRLNFDKRYITLAPVATLIGLAFKLKDPDHLLGDNSEPGITVALVPADTPGVDTSQRHVPLDIPFQNGPVYGKDVFIPIEQIIGGLAGVGQGWRMLMDALAEGRGISLPALATGAGKTASRYTGAYAQVRRQFNLSIGKFEGIEEALARIAGLTYQMDAARKLALSALDLGEKPAVISAIIKYHLTEKYRQVVNDAMDIQGGSGICLGPSNLMGRVYQALPIAVTVEGANILTRSMIIFGQGAMRCHPWVLKEIQAIRMADERQALVNFDRALLGHIGFVLGNMARSLFLGLSRGRFSRAPHAGVTRRYYQQLNWMSAAFALCADMAMMTLGGALKRKERLSARLGDILSELYLTSAVLKQFEDDGHPAEDLPLVHWNCELSFYRMQESFRALFRNLPFAPLRLFLRLVVFPTGLPYTVPTDRSDKKLAGLLLKPSATRERLTAGIFLSTDEGTRQGMIESAFIQSAQVEATEKTLHQARSSGIIQGKGALQLAQAGRDAGVISEEALESIALMETLRQKVIAVDSFADYGQKNVLQLESTKRKIA